VGALKDARDARSAARTEEIHEKLMKAAQSTFRQFAYFLIHGL
jgi:hypothetical protein